MNADGSRNIADPVFLLNVLFAGTEDVDCLDAHDDGARHLSDAVFMLQSGVVVETT